MSYVFVERFKLINDMKHSLRNGFNYLVNRVFTLLTALLPRKTALELFWVRNLSANTIFIGMQTIKVQFTVEFL